MFNFNNNKIFFPVVIGFFVLAVFLVYNLYTGKTFSTSIPSGLQSQLDSMEANSSLAEVNPRTGLKEYAVRSATLTPGAIIQKDSSLFVKWDELNYHAYAVTSRVDSMLGELEKDSLVMIPALDKNLNGYQLKLLIERYIMATNEIRDRIGREKVGVNYFAGYSNNRPWPVHFFNRRSAKAMKDSLLQIRGDINDMQFDTDIEVNNFAKQ